MKLKRISSLFLLVASFINRRRHLLFPFAVFAAALSIGTVGIANAEQCDFPAIAFTSTRDDPLPPAIPQLAAEIYLIKMNEGGTVDTMVESVRVTNNTDGDAFPALSPDGKKIVFDSNRLRGDGPINTSDLFLMNTDGTEQTPLIRGSSPSWSPDGKYITFHRSASGTGLPIKIDPGAATDDSDIFIMNVDDFLKNVEGAINVTNTPGDIDDDPDWSPDGQKIVFTRHPVTDDPNNSVLAEIYVLNLETGAETRVTFNSEEERAPAWSPDGTRIVFSCRRGGNDFEICVMNSDGTGANDPPLTNNTVGDLTPSWSPDGQKIVFHRPVAGRLQLWLMNADGTGETQLTSTLGINLFAKWGVARVNCDKFWPPLPPVN
jgi:Tol biopolymer transport system component